MSATEKQQWIESVLGVSVEPGLARNVAAHLPSDNTSLQRMDGYAKARLAWLSARRQVEHDISSLREQIAAVFDGDDAAPEFDRIYASRVAPILQTLDESLADLLDAAINAQRPDERKKHLLAARKVMSNYRSYIASEPVIAGLEANPLIEIRIVRVLTSALDQFERLPV